MAHETVNIARPTRFISDQRERFEQYIDAAKNYVGSLGSDGASWLYQKPFDANNGHVFYFDSMYAILNLLQAMSLPKGARVLEVGCGPGWITEILLMLGYDVVALEPAVDLVDIAKKRVDSLMAHHHFDVSGKIEFQPVPMEELSLPDQTFDGILFYAVLHHVVDEKLTLKKSFDLLKPGGVVGVYEGAWHPDFKDLEASLEEEMRVHGTLENPFTIDYLNECLHEAGFRGVNRYIAIDGYIPSWAAEMSLASAWKQRPDGVNNLTARKPLLPDSLDWAASIEIVTQDVVDQRISVDVEITNLGNFEMQGGRYYPGAVTVSIYRGALGSDGFRECRPRAILPRTINPGEKVTVHIDTQLPDDAGPDDRWVIGLIQEHRAWLENEGVTPTPLRPF